MNNKLSIHDLDMTMNDKSTNYWETGTWKSPGKCDCDTNDPLYTCPYHLRLADLYLSGNGDDLRDLKKEDEYYDEINKKQEEEWREIHYANRMTAKDMG